MERARVLLSLEKGGSLRVSSLQDRVEFRSEDKLAAMPTILRVHDVNYVMKLINGCQKSKVFFVFSTHAARKPAHLARHRHHGQQPELLPSASRCTDGLFGSRRTLSIFALEFQNSERFLCGSTAGSSHWNGGSGEKPEQSVGYAGILFVEQCGDRCGVCTSDVREVRSDCDRGFGYSSRKWNGGLCAAFESVPKRIDIDDGEYGDKVGL